MLGIVFLLLFYLVAPFLINYACYKSSLLQKLGSVLIAYAVGLVMGNIGIFPEASPVMLELITNKDIKLNQDIVESYFAAGTISEDD